jgi:hypothetical protein
MLWLQGFDDAPPVPRACIESWRACNPGWDVTALSADTLADWVSPILLGPRARNLTPQQLSDLVRLDLLARYGGVWADATCYCIRPLDEWLPACAASGFFAFARPRRDRLLSNWFLASEAGGLFPCRMWEKFSAYLLRRTVKVRGRGRAVDLLGRALNRNWWLPALWFTPPLPQLAIRPYFAFHYMAARLMITDRAFRASWRATQVVPADGPLIPLFAGLDKPPSPLVLDDIEKQMTPMYKLDWRADPARLPADSTLNVLLNRR